MPNSQLWHSCRKWAICLRVKCPLFLSDFNHTWLFLAGFREKCSNIKFHGNPSSGSQLDPFGRTGITKLTVAFRNMPPYLKQYGHQIHLRNRFHVRYNWITAQGKMLMSHSAVRTRLKRSELQTGFSESQCSDRQDQISTFTGITVYYG